MAHCELTVRDDLSFLEAKGVAIVTRYVDCKAPCSNLPCANT